MTDNKAPTVTDTAVIDSPTASQTAVNEFHDGTDEGRKAFLATFTADDDKAIRRKVDKKFLLLIGIIYLIKNVRGDSSKPLFEQD